MAIHNAFQYIRDRPMEEMVVVTDSLIAIQAMQDEVTVVLSHEIIQELISLMHRVTLQWIPAHC